jgi:TonB family protein
MPNIRPALIGNGPKALINLIDTQALMKKGQGNAILLFSCRIEPSGQSYAHQVYRVSAGGEKLKDEVKLKLFRARFIPAVYNYRNTYSWFYGTVMFAVVDGKPRLRIYANQEITELERGSDFIEPQAIYVPNHFYKRIPYPSGPWATEERPAIVDLSLNVDATGKVLDVQVLKETPPDHKYGETAVKQIKELTFLPAFRNGQPVASTSHINFVFMPGGWRWK